MEIVRVKVIERVKVVLYTLGSPEWKLKQCSIFGGVASVSNGSSFGPGG